MKLISVFNNKGGVGKTTLKYHLACALAELGKKVLMLDLDPQCNLTIYGLDSESLHKIWQDEDGFIVLTFFKNVFKNTRLSVVAFDDKNPRLTR